MKKIFYIISIFLLFLLIIVGGVYLFFSIDPFKKAQGIGSLNAEFNIKNTKLATIPSKFPEQTRCEGLNISLNCFVTAYAAQSIVFSPSGNTVAYKLVPGASGSKQGTQGAQVIIDNEKGHKTTTFPYYLSGEKDIVFSPDGSKIIYIAENNGRPVLVINEKQETPHDQVFLPEFSSDGRRMAYVIEDGGSMYAIIDGKKEGPYDSISKFSNNKFFLFSDDGKHVLYTATHNDSNFYSGYMFAVLDGVKQNNYKKVFDPIFLPSGEIVYLVIKASKIQNSSQIDHYLISPMGEEKIDGVFGLDEPSKIFMLNNQIGYVRSSIINKNGSLYNVDKIFVGNHEWQHILDKDWQGRSQSLVILSPGKNI